MAVTVVGLVSLFLGWTAYAQSDLSGDWDVVVIGGGLMGSISAWQLARDGQRVLLLEKQGEVYTQGSSLGEARLSRSLGPPGDIWSYMRNRTVTEARELVAFLNKRGEAADMSDIYTTSPVNEESLSDDEVAWALKACFDTSHSSASA